MRPRLLPLPFFIGLALGLIALAWLGATVQSKRMVDGFVRFHRMMNLETGYFPTARQVRTIVEHAAQANPKVFVIVGGSSTFHGVGQHASLIWTRFLQEHLGSDFRVINLAQRAGSSAEFGNIAAELLLLQSRPVIYVGDASINNYTNLLEDSWYRYITVDAWKRGYLLPWAPRDKLIAQAAWRDSPLRGPALGAALDRYLNFNDLWNFVTYEYAGSIWNPDLRNAAFHARNLSFHPRHAVEDPEPMPDHFERVRYDGRNLEAEMRAVRGEILPPSSRLWGGMIEATEQLTPPQLRAVTMVVVNLASPQFFDRLEPTERDALTAQAEAQTRRFKDLGFGRAVVAARDFTANDYVDRVHLSVAGGEKLAAGLAPTIRTMATELGYLP